MAAIYKNKKVEEKEESCDSYAVVISQALKSVIPENQLSCLIAVLQLIEKFKEWMFFAKLMLHTKIAFYFKLSKLSNVIHFYL